MTQTVVLLEFTRVSFFEFFCLLPCWWSPLPAAGVIILDWPLLRCSYIEWSWTLKDWACRSCVWNNTNSILSKRPSLWEIYGTLVHLFISQWCSQHLLWATMGRGYSRKQKKEKSLPSWSLHSIGTKNIGCIYSKCIQATFAPLLAPSCVPRGWDWETATLPKVRSRCPVGSVHTRSVALLGAQS